MTERRLYYGWVLVGALSLTQLVSWGVLYYAFGALLPLMEADLGWSRTTLTGAFSLSLLVGGLAGPLVGRWLDAHGTRVLMTVGSVGATLLVLGWSAVSGITGFYLVWAGIGLVSALVLYEPAFAAVAVWFRAQRSRALAVLTFFGGLASLVCIPLTQWLAAAFGWRGALVWLALLLGALTILPHALLLRRRPEDLGLLPDGANIEATSAPEVSVSVGVALRGAAFWWTAAAFGLLALVQIAHSVHFVSYLRGAGYDAGFAALAAGLHGLMSVSGRLTIAPLGGRLSAARLLVGLFLLEALAIGVLLLAGSEIGVLAHVALFGLSVGAATPLRAALVAERYGRAVYGRINGALALIGVAPRALGPVGVGWLSLAVGYRPALLTLAGCAALGALCLALSQKDPSPV